jgi:hypothetical protein
MAYQKKVKEEAIKEAPVAEVKESVQEVIPTPEVKQPPKVVKVDRDQQVECRNVTIGQLTYRNQNGYQIDWDNYGDVQWMSVGELMNMKASQGRFLNEPWLVIEDEDVVKYLGLKPVYDKMIEIDDIETFLFSGLDNIEAVLKVAPRGTKELIRDKARAMIADETLYDIRVIKFLEKALEFGFNQE